MAESLPDCEACGSPITFYMHQRWNVAAERMLYWHPECCPDDFCRVRRSTVADWRNFAVRVLGGDNEEAKSAD